MEDEARDDDLIAVCSECKSDVPESYMKKNAFFLQGSAASCPYCGGVVLLVYRADRDNAVRQSDIKRGLGNPDGE